MVALNLELASESQGVLVKTLIVDIHLQSF